MEKTKNIDKYLDKMDEANTSGDFMSIIDLAIKYSNLVQAAYRLEIEIKEAVGYGIMEDEPKHAVTYDVVDNALSITSCIVRNRLCQFEFDTAVDNGLEEEA